MKYKEKKNQRFKCRIEEYDEKYISIIIYNHIASIQDLYDIEGSGMYVHFSC